MKQYLLGVDLGTSNVKAVLFSEIGEICGQGERQYATYHDRPGYAEHDLEECWEQTALAIRQALASNSWKDGRICGVCVSSNAPTMLPLDENGRPLRKGLIWMDRRAVDEADLLVDRFGGPEEYTQHFGANADPFYLNAKLFWFARHEPELLKRTKKVLLTNGYINFKLTDVYSVDSNQASIVSHCFDRTRRCWDQQLMDYIGVDLDAILPKPVDAYDVIGAVTGQASKATGLPVGTPVVCGTADGAAAPLETGIVRMGDAADITGTSSLLFYAFDKPSIGGNPLMHVVQSFPLPETPYMLQGSVNTSGASLKWYAGLFAQSICNAAKGSGDNPFSAMDALAAQAAPGCNGLLYFPYLAGERAPLWNSDLRGMFIGLTTRTGHGELARAILEGTSFAVREITEFAKDAGARVERFYSSGGGAKSEIWTKIKASMLHLPIAVSLNSGGAPQGDALIAGYGTGVFKNFPDAVKQFKKIDRVIDPVPEWSKVYDDLYGSFVAMRKTLLVEQTRLNDVIRSDC